MVLRGLAADRAASSPEQGAGRHQPDRKHPEDDEKGEEVGD